MSAANTELVRFTIEEVFNQKKPALITRIYAPDCRGHSPDGPMQGWAGFTSFFEKYAAAFPDFRLYLECIIAERERVAASYIFAGTHSGPLSGFPATGCSVNIPGIMVTRILNDCIAEQYFVWDNLAPRRQIWQAMITGRMQGKFNQNRTESVVIGRRLKDGQSTD